MFQTQKNTSCSQSLIAFCWVSDDQIAGPYFAQNSGASGGSAPWAPGRGPKAGWWTPRVYKGTPLPDPPPARLLCSLAVLLADKGFRRHGKYRSFPEALDRFARSLIIDGDECIWNVMLKARCYRLAPLLFFSGSKCQILPALGGGRPLPILPPARSLRSLAILLADYFRRVSENCFFSLYVQNFHLVLFNSWWIAWKFLWKNCHESIQNNVDIALQSI